MLKSGVAEMGNGAVYHSYGNVPTGTIAKCIIVYVSQNNRFGNNAEL
jgi:hypothetical protein